MKAEQVRAATLFILMTHQSADFLNQLFYEKPLNCHIWPSQFPKGLQMSGLTDGPTKI